MDDLNKDFLEQSDLDDLDYFRDKVLYALAGTKDVKRARKIPKYKSALKSLKQLTMMIEGVLIKNMKPKEIMSAAAEMQEDAETYEGNSHN